MAIAEEKRALRTKIKQELKKLTHEQKQLEADAVFAQLRRSGLLDRASTLLLYWSMPDELPTHRYVAELARDYRVLLPVVKGDDLELRLFEGVDSLQAVPPFGILEPVNSPVVVPREVDVALVPGLAFDPLGHRLGRGKGFYDRLIPHFTHTLLVGICHQCQLLPEVPTEPHDRQLCMVLTPGRLYSSYGS